MVTSEQATRAENGVELALAPPSGPLVTNSEPAAVRQADDWSLRICQPIARYWYAEMLRTRGSPGDNAQARSLLGAALSMFESIGAPLYARHASEALAAVKD